MCVYICWFPCWHRARSSTCPAFRFAVLANGSMHTRVFAARRTQGHRKCVSYISVCGVYSCINIFIVISSIIIIIIIIRTVSKNMFPVSRTTLRIGARPLLKAKIFHPLTPRSFASNFLGSCLHVWGLRALNPRSWLSQSHQHAQYLGDYVRATLRAGPHREYCHGRGRPRPRPTPRIYIRWLVGCSSRSRGGPSCMPINQVAVTSSLPSES